MSISLAKRTAIKRMADTHMLRMSIWVVKVP